MLARVSRPSLGGTRWPRPQRKRRNAGRHRHGRLGRACPGEIWSEGAPPEVSRADQRVSVQATGSGRPLPPMMPRGCRSPEGRRGVRSSSAGKGSTPHTQACGLCRSMDLSWRLVSSDDRSHLPPATCQPFHRSRACGQAWASTSPVSKVIHRLPLDGQAPLIARSPSIVRTRSPNHRPSPSHQHRLVVRPGGRS